MSGAAVKRWTWGIAAVAVVLALVTEALLFLKSLGCGLSETHPESCNGLTGSGDTISTVVYVAAPACAVIALIGGWKNRRSLALLALTGLAVAFIWVLSVGSGSPAGS
jgi:hypothetical protein